MVNSAGEEHAIRPRFVIAADGALSTVANALGLKRHRFLIGIQVEAPLAKPLDRTFVFLARDFVGGYAWFLPKGKAANVGLAVIAGETVKPRLLLQRFVRFLAQKGLIRTGRLARYGGPIPVSGMRDNLVVDNVLFAGDAAGLTHPMTGEGISSALVSGDLASGAVVSTLRTGRLRHLDDYDSEIRNRYGESFDHALAKRDFMNRTWDRGDFSALCYETWTGFDGYRKQIADYNSSQKYSRIASS